MIIIGAGMAGLIAANYFRKLNPTILEKQAGLPDNHGALLRFRSDKVFRVTGMQGRKVTVRKAIAFGMDFMSEPNPYLANQYSLKVTGRVEDRSIWNMETAERWIAPDDFLEKLALGTSIRYNSIAQVEKGRAKLDPIISTLPMPVLMKQLEWKDMPEFKTTPIWVISCKYPLINVNQTIYFPANDVPYYRASFVGGKFIIELTRDPGDEAESIIDEVVDFFGIDPKQFIREDVNVKHQLIGKMVPIDDHLRREFMHHATSRYNIYSLGRFATWRPILLDDVVDDLSVIEKMMSSNYNALRAK